MFRFQDIRTMRNRRKSVLDSGLETVKRSRLGILWVVGQNLPNSGTL